MATHAYPCIGGPLDGQFASSDDFSRYDPKRCPQCEHKHARKSWQDTGCSNCGAPLHYPGAFAGLRSEYVQFNCSHGARHSTSATPSMVWLHKPLIDGKKQITTKQQAVRLGHNYI